MIPTLLLLSVTAIARVDIDGLLSRPYTPEVPFGSSGDRMWATSPQGWAFSDGVNFLYATERSVYGVKIEAGESFYQVKSATYYPSHIHMVGKPGPMEPTASASFSSQGDPPSNPLSEPFRPEKRWTCWNSKSRTDSYTLTYDAAVRLKGIDLWFFDDLPRGECAPPESVLIERRTGSNWVPIEVEPATIRAGRTEFRFRSEVSTDAIRFTFRNRGELYYTGLYGVKPIIESAPTKNSPIRVEGDKWISEDDALVTCITLTNPSRKSEPYDIAMRPDNIPSVDVDGFTLRTAMDGYDGHSRSREFSGKLRPGERKRFTFACGVDDKAPDRVLRHWIYAEEPLAMQRKEYLAWFAKEAPTFECSDPLVTKMYYHRLYNLKKNSMNPRLGRLNHRAFSEGRWRSSWYANVISYGAGHQIRESRWLKDGDYAWGHLRTFTENERPDGIYPSHVTPKGQQGGRYTDWITSSAWDTYLVHPDKALLKSVLPALAANAEGWRKVYGWGGSPLLVVDDHWWTGMEWQPSFFSFNGYHTDHEDPLRRVDLTAYNYGNEMAVARAYRALGDTANALKFSNLAEETRQAVLKQMWDPETRWFHSLRAKDDAMSPAKEIIGIYPFTFDLPVGPRTSESAGSDLRSPARSEARGPTGYDSAWATLLDQNLFWTKWPLASAAKDCPAFAQDGWPIGPGGSGCMWNGPSWPHANGLVMTAMENALRHDPNSALTKEAFFDLFDSFTRVQYKDGQPWTGEFYNGDTGEWKTAEHDYNHSIWLDPLIGGLIGVVPRADDVLEIDPLLPDGKWNHWRLEGLWYHGHRISIAFDRRLGKRAFTVAVDSRRVYVGPRPVHVLRKLSNRTERR